MSEPRRLFLFAGYDKDGIIDDALNYYVRTLSKYGDVIVCMDCDMTESETDKLKPYTIATMAKRHCEYDFGSYKRCFQYAKEHHILKNYDILYMVNDSVFGPMFDISKTLKKIEKKQTDACGLIVSTHKTHEYMESWFVRLNKTIFMSDWFDTFICSVKQEQAKTAVTIKYEHGLTNIIAQHNYSWSGAYTIHGRETYNRPKYLFKHGCPFIKKLSFTRHNGALGRQIKFILKHSDKTAAKHVINSATRLYGKEYMNWFLTSNPLKIFWRNITYAIKKIKNGQI